MEVVVTVKAVVVDTTAAEAEEGENFNCIQRFFSFKPFFSFIGLLVLHIFLHFTLLIQIMIKIHTVMVGVVMEAVAAAVDITEVVAEEVEGEKLLISNLVHKLFTFFLITSYLHFTPFIPNSQPTIQQIPTSKQIRRRWRWQLWRWRRWWRRW